MYIITDLSFLKGLKYELSVQPSFLNASKYYRSVLKNDFVVVVVIVIVFVLMGMTGGSVCSGSSYWRILKW